MGDNSHRTYGELPVNPIHYDNADFKPGRRDFLKSNVAALGGFYLTGAGAYADGVGDGYRETQLQNTGDSTGTPNITNKGDGIDPVDVARLGGVVAVGASAVHDVSKKGVDGKKRALFKIGAAAVVDISTHALGEMDGKNQADADARHKKTSSLTPPANGIQTAPPTATTTLNRNI